MAIRTSRTSELVLQHTVVDGSATLRPLVDGVDLLAGYRNDRGLDPDRLLPPLSATLLPTAAGRRA